MAQTQDLSSTSSEEVSKISIPFGHERMFTRNVSMLPEASSYEF